MRTLFIVYDNGSYVGRFPQNVAYLIHSISDISEVVIYNQDIHHYPESHLTNLLDRDSFDYVCLGFIGGYYQYRKALQISIAVNNSINRNKFTYILGGHGPSPEPEYFLNKMGADIVVIGEGEATLNEIVAGKTLQHIQGIAYLLNGKLVANGKRDVLLDVSKIPLPAYSRFDINYYRLQRVPNCERTDFVMPVLSGRGCPYKCNFCYRMDKGHRQRSVEHIEKELQYLINKYAINYFTFSDELLMVSKGFVEDICKMLLKLKRRHGVKWNCNGRLNMAAKDKNILKLMKESGCVFINYGIEAYDDYSLKKMNKHLTMEEIRTGIENTLETGISPGFNMIFGNIGDTKNSLDRSVSFLLKYDDHSQMRTVRPVTPYPGSPLYYYAIEKGLLTGCEDFYENKHTNSDLLTVNLTESMSDNEIYSSLLYANSRLLDAYYTELRKKNTQTLAEVYIDRSVDFRGFRPV